MLTSFLYRKGKPLEFNVSRAQMFAALAEKDAFLWVDLENPTEFESDCLVEIFNFHALAIEDCLNDQSQPKADDYEEYLFLVMHAVQLVHDEEGKKEEGKKHELITKELDIFLGRNYVVTFHQIPIKSLSGVRETTIKKPEITMGHGPDMLVYNILDHLVDHYQPVLEDYDRMINQIEEEIFNNPPANYLSSIMQVKRDIFNLRRIVSPQRDTVNFITRNPTPFIKTRHMMYFRDIYDHLFRIYGSVEGFHEILAGVLQAYFSYSSHKLNEIMKRMTVLATLTMPSIIVASIYGMNFRNMPELEWPYGYYLSIVLMGVTSIGMLIWMKFKKWI
ncbi:MAG: magnesium/cobalt transporter CorA [Candidatus Omnitrophica bacterium]|nr:magnesium/cobalt transporter CorA [Candidatus Omnitrophota bacterium]